MQKLDVAIVGGGVVGTSILHSLMKKDPTLEAALFEKRQLGAGSTGKSVGGIRHLYSTPLNIEIGKRSINFFKNFAQNVGYEVEFRQSGYAYLIHSSEVEAEWRKRLELYDSHDVQVEMLSPKQTVELFPPLDETTIRGAIFSPDCGHVDPHSTTQMFARAAREQGGQIFTNCPVEDVEFTETGVEAVVTPEGTFEVEHLINAAGPWAPGLSEMLGVPLPIDITARRIAVTNETDISDSPLMIDIEKGCYFKSEVNGSLLLCDMGQDLRSVGELEETNNQRPSYEYYLSITNKVGELLTIEDELQITNGWTGLQAHTPDSNAIVGPSGVDGYLLACGFSGHGVQQAPIIAEEVASLIVDGEYLHPEMSKFHLSRFSDGSRLEVDDIAATESNGG